LVTSIGEIISIDWTDQLPLSYARAMKASPPIHPGHAWILGVVVDEHAADGARRAPTADGDIEHAIRPRSGDRAAARGEQRPTRRTA
jgi:hypothetical protein